ncbi:peptidase E [Thermoleophilia bacterium SCSIO 60948]|nr:peptidase E [Thermoleophilia bacterium SCSIO 60948]
MASGGGDAETVAENERTILAMGGHEFSRKRGNEALRDYMLAQLESERPRICLLPTASGDPDEQIRAFHSALGASGCELSHLSLFRLESEPVELAEHLLAQDLIYVGGGSLVNLIAIWRAHGLDEILTRAWRRGVVLAGLSAGAMCWFEGGITRSRGDAGPAPGLGLLPGSACVHLGRDPDRRPAYLSAVGEGDLGPGYALSDQAGILFRGREPAEVVQAVDGADVFRVEPDGEGGATERRLDARRLDDPRPAIDDPGDDVRELRALRGRMSGARRG